MKPSNIHREHGTVASFWCLDGALDELKLYSRALAPTEVAMALANVAPVADCEIQPRRMPSGPKVPGRFGAIYCKLKYYSSGMRCGGSTTILTCWFASTKRRFGSSSGEAAAIRPPG